MVLSRGRSLRRNDGNDVVTFAPRARLFPNWGEQRRKPSDFESYPPRKLGQIRRGQNGGLSGTRTRTPFGLGILSAVRLPVSPRGLGAALVTCAPRLAIRSVDGASGGHAFDDLGEKRHQARLRGADEAVELGLVLVGAHAQPVKRALALLGQRERDAAAVVRRGLARDEAVLLQVLDAGSPSTCRGRSRGRARSARCRGSGG
jgi:hypothetical protein